MLTDAHWVKEKSRGGEIHVAVVCVTVCPENVPTSTTSNQVLRALLTVRHTIIGTLNFSSECL